MKINHENMLREVQIILDKKEVNDETKITDFCKRIIMEPALCGFDFKENLCPPIKNATHVSYFRLDNSMDQLGELTFKPNEIIVLITQSKKDGTLGKGIKLLKIVADNLEVNMKNIHYQMHITDEIKEGSWKLEMLVLTKKKN